MELKIPIPNILYIAIDPLFKTADSIKKIFTDANIINVRAGNDWPIKKAKKFISN